MPVGWVLASMNWWRLGERKRAFGTPFASLMTLLVLMAVLRAGTDWLHLRSTPAMDLATLVIQNAGAMLVNVSGLDGPVNDQRLAGGVSANRWIPLAVLALSVAAGWFFLTFDSR
jgi:hypothetical protein